MVPQSPLEIHHNRFGAQGLSYQAPGRVNLIGEHTDTSEGYVMPAALDLHTISVLSPRSDSIANIYSVNFAEQVTLDLQHLPGRPRGHWSDYPASVLWTLEQRGVHPDGFDLTLSGNVPLGSGLSSSASVEVAVAVAVLAHTGPTLTEARDRQNLPVLRKQLCRCAERHHGSLHLLLRSRQPRAADRLPLARL